MVNKSLEEMTDEDWEALFRMTDDDDASIEVGSIEVVPAGGRKTEAAEVGGHSAEAVPAGGHSAEAVLADKDIAEQPGNFFMTGEGRLRTAVVGVGSAGRAVVELLMKHDKHGDDIRYMLVETESRDGKIMIRMPDDPLFPDEGDRIVYVICGASGEGAKRLAPKLASIFGSYYLANVIGVCFTPMDFESDEAKLRAKDTQKALCREVDSLIRVPLRLPGDTKPAMSNCMECRAKRRMLEAGIWEHADMLVAEFIRGISDMINEPAQMMNWDTPEVYRQIKGNKDLHLGMVRFWKDQLIDEKKIEDGLEQMIADAQGSLRSNWSQGVLIQMEGGRFWDAYRVIAKYFEECFPNTAVLRGLKYIREEQEFVKAICLW